MSKLRLAVIGAGRLGGFHAQKLAKRDDVELVAIVDTVESSRQRVASECGAKPLADYAELIGQVDAAVVATPTTFHYDVSRKLIDAGMHLLIEKPLCTTHIDAERLVKIAQQRGVVLQVGHVERFNPAFQAAAAKIDSPKYIEGVRSSGYTFRSTDVGVVLDLMIHDIDLVLSLVRGRLRKIEAIGVPVVGPHEDAANARLEFDCGCVAVLSASRVSYEAVRRMHIWSAGSFASVDFAARATTTVIPSETLRQRRFNVDGLSPQELEHCRQHFAEEHLPQERKTFDAVDALALEQDDFLDSIRNSRVPLVSGEAGRDAMAVAEQILNRIRSNRWDSSVNFAPRPFTEIGPETKAA
jgi:predicted dehydrogenase